jgi:hypothetical protein
MKPSVPALTVVVSSKWRSQLGAAPRLGATRSTWTSSTTLAHRKRSMRAWNMAGRQLPAHLQPRQGVTSAALRRISAEVYGKQMPK